MTRRNDRSNSSRVSPASTSRAMPINRLDSSGSSGAGVGLRGMAERLAQDDAFISAVANQVSNRIFAIWEAVKTDQAISGLLAEAPQIVMPRSPRVRK